MTERFGLKYGAHTMWNSFSGSWSGISSSTARNSLTHFTRSVNCDEHRQYRLEIYLLWDYLITNWKYYCRNGCKDCIVALLYIGLSTVHCLIYRILFYLFASFEKHCYISGLFIGGQHCWTRISLSGSLLLLFKYYVHMFTSIDLNGK